MQNQLRLAALFLLAGEGCLAAMAALVKGLGENLSHETLLFARNFFGLLFLLPFLIRGGIPQLKTKRLKVHLFRALSGVCAMYGFFYVILHLPLAEATLVKLSTPLWLPCIALLMLGDRMTLRNGLALVLGFLGVGLIMRPQGEEVTLVMAVGILAAGLAAVAKVCIRWMSDTEPSARIVFYFALFSTLISAVPLIWGWQQPAPEAWLLLALLGLLGTSGQLLMTQAYRLAKPSLVGVYAYSSVVYAMLLGWVFWAEIPSLWTWLGTLVIVVAGLINLKRT